MADSNSLFGGSKDKVIETENFTIRGHLLRWGDTAIQISNISSVSIELPHVADIPYHWILILSIAGAWFINDGELTIGTLIASLGIFFFCVICVAVLTGFAVAGLGMQLKIRMDSGDVYSFSFSKNKEFMRQVFQLLANIIETGTTPQTNFHVSVTNCEIRENGAIVHVQEQ